MALVTLGSGPDKQQQPSLLQVDTATHSKKGSLLSIGGPERGVWAQGRGQGTSSGADKIHSALASPAAQERVKGQCAGGLSPSSLCFELLSGQARTACASDVLGPSVLRVQS